MSDPGKLEEAARPAAGVTAASRPAGEEELGKERSLRAAIEAPAGDLRIARADHGPVWASGFLQIDWIVHDQSSSNAVSDGTGALLNEDRFTLRRGHVRVDATEGLTSGAIEIDANTTRGPEVRPIDAEVALRWPSAPVPGLPSLRTVAGLIRIPFGYELRELDWIRPFLERTNAAQALFPGEYDLGARIDAAYRAVRLSVAVMNGSPIGTKQFPDLAPVAEKELVGRVGVDVSWGDVARLEAGTSLDVGHGFHAGTPTTKNTITWQDANGDGVVQPNEITVIPGSAATPSRTFNRFAFGGDVRLAVRLGSFGEFGLRAEAVTAVNLDRGLDVADPVSTGRDMRELGWTFGATQDVTRWGMVGVRYDGYDSDLDKSVQRGVSLVPATRRYTTLALMAMLRNGDQRLVLEYDVNSNPLGISPDGSPTTLADDALTLRAQCVF